MRAFIPRDENGNPKSDFKLIEIMEEAVYQQASIQMSSNSGNKFERAVRQGELFKQVGLEPVYFIDPDTNKLYVTCEETINREYH